MVQNLAKTQSLNSKFFQTLLLNFIKRILQKGWIQFCPFRMDKSEQNEAKIKFMLKTALFSFFLPIIKI